MVHPFDEISVGEGKATVPSGWQGMPAWSSVSRASAVSA